MKTQYSNNPTQPEIAIGNPKSGSQVAAQVAAETPGAEDRQWAGRWSQLPSDHLKRWEKRLYIPKSGGVSLRKLAVRVQHLGRREEFRFDTTNRAAAASQALDVFRFLKANGWEATLAKFKPEAQVVTKFDVTIGDFLSAMQVAAVPSPLKLRTFLNYRTGFRTIASEALGVRGSKAKYDYRSGGNAEWLNKVHALRLDRLTPEAVNQWKKERISGAGHSPAAITSAKRTVNSYIRCARSLFSPALLKLLKDVQLPAVLPFAGVELEDAGSTKYISKVNARALIAAARLELKPRQPEAYKVFLLGLFAGMRKAEIDSLEWRMVDFENAVINLEETEWLHLKTQDSADEITVDAEVLGELKELMPATAGRFIVSSEIHFQKRARGGKEMQCVRLRQPRSDSARAYYRCKPVFDELNAWLRGKGISANKPLHELRKEIGALIATEHGIYAASRFLRHSDITTTARHYADQKKRITVGLGKLLDTGIKAVPAEARQVA